MFLSGKFLSETKYEKSRDFLVVSVRESTCQCRGYRFNPWSRKIPQAMEQLSLNATSTEPMGCNYWSPCALESKLWNRNYCNEKPHTTTKSSPDLLQPRFRHFLNWKMQWPFPCLRLPSFFSSSLSPSNTLLMVHYSLKLPATSTPAKGLYMYLPTLNSGGAM